ncbi:hypothetical protein [Roseibium sp.]|uniref:hypothetical protein n=1 Tax=Roseibium sp. TaxID=1936156 RepID=UPI003A975611
MHIVKQSLSIVTLCVFGALPTTSMSSDLDLGFVENTVEYDLGCRTLFVDEKKTELNGFRYHKMHVAMTASGQSKEMARAAILTEKRVWENNINNSNVCTDKGRDVKISNKFEIIVDLEQNYAGFPEKPFVLASKEVCSGNPTLVFVSRDSIFRPLKANGSLGRNVVTQLLNKEFYGSDSRAPTGTSDLAGYYADTYNKGEPGFSAKYDRLRIYPHQFYASPGKELKIPVTRDEFEENDTNVYGANAVMIGLYYAVAAMKAECNSLPNAIDIKGLMFIQKDSIGSMEFKSWKQYFSGSLDFRSENPKIVPDEGYKETANLLGNYYDVANKANAEYKPSPRSGFSFNLDNDTAVALGAAFFGSIFAIEIMENNEKCRNDPSKDCWN